MVITTSSAVKASSAEGWVLPPDRIVTDYLDFDDQTSANLAVANINNIKLSDEFSNVQAFALYE